MSNKRFFSYSCENGMLLHDTAAAAKAVAEAELEAYREAAYDDGWSQDTGSTCWGEIRQRAIETDRTEIPEADRHLTDAEYSCNYQLRDVAPQADVITLTVKQAQSMSDTLKVVAGSVDNKGAASAINSIAGTLRGKIEAAGA